MNPLADFIDLPARQFLLVYAAVAFFAAVFLVYVRWECRQIEELAARPEPELDRNEIGYLAHGDAWVADRPEAEQAQLRARLVELELLVTDAANRRMRRVVAIVMALLAGLCAVKIPMNLAKSKPVLGLLLAIAATVASGLMLGIRRLGTTSHGEALLEKLRAAGRVPPLDASGGHQPSVP